MAANGGKDPAMTNPLPADILEQRAAEQRRRLHNSVVEIRSQVREKMDYRRLARQYVLPASGVAALVGLIMGHSFAGIFTRD